MHEPLILRTIHRYRPNWEPPEDNGKEWVRCLCPFHAESRPSAAVSFGLNAFNCLGCGLAGNHITLITKLEEISYQEAERITKTLLAEGDNPLPPKSSRKPGRKVFGDTGSDRSEYQGGGQQVPSRVRGRPAPWA